MSWRTYVSRKYVERKRAEPTATYTSFAQSIDVVPAKITRWIRNGAQVEGGVAEMQRIVRVLGDDWVDVRDEISRVSWGEPVEVAILHDKTINEDDRRRLLGAFYELRLKADGSPIPGGYL